MVVHDNIKARQKIEYIKQICKFCEDTLKQIEYLEGFLKSVDKKLSNKNFVDNAPQNVVDIERKKRDDAVIKLENLKKSI